MGCIYRRKGVLWIKYYRNGRSFYESSRTGKKEVAMRLLKRREGEIAKGELPGICFDKVRFDELAVDYTSDYKVNGRRTLAKAERCARYLREAFGGMRATEITTTRIRSYIESRIGSGLSHASINRELAALKRMLRLGAQSTPPKIGQIPHIPMLKESNTRKGFFEHEEFLRVRDALPFHLKPVVTFGYHTGWRKEEILGLTLDKLDLKQGVVRLDPGETKNEDGRVIYLDDELMKELKALHSTRPLGCPYVFHFNGMRIKDFRGAWNTACRKVGLMGKLFHDFRRTAVRNMLRSGIREKVAMMISGHKTRSVFDRYHIVTDEDLKEAAVKQQKFLDAQAETSSAGYKHDVAIPFQQTQGTA